MRSRPLIAVLLLSLAACAAPAKWTKDGASQTAADADLENCRKQAAQAPVLREPHRLSQSILAGGPDSMYDEVMDDRLRHEAQFVQKCMQEKGYSVRR